MFKWFVIYVFRRIKRSKPTGKRNQVLYMFEIVLGFTATKSSAFYITHQRAMIVSQVTWVLDEERILGEEKIRCRHLFAWIKSHLIDFFRHQKSKYWIGVEEISKNKNVMPSHQSLVWKHTLAVQYSQYRNNNS